MRRRAADPDPNYEPPMTRRRAQEQGFIPPPIDDSLLRTHRRRNPAGQHVDPAQDQDQDQAQDQAQPEPSAMEQDLLTMEVLDSETLDSDVPVNTDQAANETDMDVLVSRTFVKNPARANLPEPQSYEQFTIVSYSIKPDALNDLGDGKIATDPPNYHERLAMEIKHLAPQILCLQWVGSEYFATLQKALNGYGYVGFYSWQRPGECSSSFGQATFVMPERFEVVQLRDVYIDELITKQANQPGVIYQDGVRLSVRSPENALLLRLRCKYTDREMDVINMRCIPEEKERSDLQTVQLCSLLQELTPSDQSSDYKRPFVVCCDVDFEPDSSSYQVLRDGEMKDGSFDKFTSIDSVVIHQVTAAQPLPGSSTEPNSSAGFGTSMSPLAAACEPGFRHNLKDIGSAYFDVLGFEPSCVWKDGARSMCAGSYVLYDKSKLEVYGVLDMVGNTHHCRLPNKDFPSSQISLKAVFSYSKGDRRDIGPAFVYDESDEEPRNPESLE